MNRVKINYLYHSGFTVETKSSLLVFDYFKDSSDKKERSLENGVITEDVLKTEKNILVFSTHSHYDHFNPSILSWSKVNPKIKYILSSDIQKTVDLEYCVHISENESIRIHNVDIKAYGSTDIGISMLVNVDGISIFHAGDLNWWHWKDESDEDNLAMEKAFKEKVEKLSNEKIDIAFFPVDSRLEEYYDLGGEYFIKKVKPKLFVPMHFADNPEITKKFKEKIKSSATDIVEIYSRGQEILF
ncbi:MBL fold metallo-hydrolase [Clostridium thailandense]|uniref:MBL fold metallo-hydrolase n=1 Tax=Clostridium thailandense TaxID=2794346 RepID=UPI00398A1A86